jgi:FkbM family methyltransferase
MESYSQLNQDLNVLDFYNKKSNLYFVDIGACDGKSLSNTYLLEKNYNWDGICIEPNEDYFNAMIKIRNVKCVKKAIFSQSNLIVDFSLCGMNSGINSYIDYHNFAINNNITQVITSTLDDILEEYSAPKFIHYLSIDTEGTELEILKSVDLNKYIFGYINLEHNYVEPRRTEMKKLLLKNNYVYKGENKWDDDFIHKSLIEGIYYYNNDFDKPIIISLNDNKLSVESSYWDPDTGIFEPNKLTFKWNKMGTGKLYYNYIDYGNNNIWHRK